MKTLYLPFIAAMLLILTQPVESFAETAFDRLLEKNDGIIPFPFTDLLLKHYEADPRSYDRLPILIPDGRSLQADSADIEAPRILVSSSQFKTADPYFLGYAPKAEQLEIISWNQEESQYDFFIVRDYAEGKVPRLVRPSRALCMSCHQNGGPIFSRSPWSESSRSRMIDFLRSGNPSSTNVLGKLTLETRNRPQGSFERLKGFAMDIFSRRDRSPEVTNYFYYGIDLRLYLPEYEASALGLEEKSSRRADPFEFDSLVRSADDLFRTSLALRKICESSLKCKKDFIRLVRYEKVIFDDSGELIFEEDPNQRRELKQSISQEFAQKINYESAYSLPSSVLPDRDPSRIASGGPVSKVFYNESVSYQLTYEDSESLLENPISGDSSLFWETPGEFEVINLFDEDNELLDPKTPRPAPYDKLRKVRDISIGHLPGYWMFYDSNEFDVLFELTFDELNLALSNPSIESLIENYWPISGARLLPQLYSVLGKPIPEALNQLPGPHAMTLLRNSSETSAANLTSGSDGSDLNDPQRVINKYCFECHGSNSDKPLPLNSLENLREYRSSLAARYVSRHRMPPRNYVNQPSCEERSIILNALNFENTVSRDCEENR